MISASKLEYQLPDRRQILTGIDFTLEKGRFLAVLGENGAGKTTLLDLVMGFRRRTGGGLEVLGEDPHHDPWRTRLRIAYLSEKVDIPGDWEARDLLDFHRYFYPGYDSLAEREWMAFFGVRDEDRVGNLSAGEIRRLQIVAALASRPDLVVADEITAVLDIVGRRKLLAVLKERQIREKLTVVLATNVPEGLEAYADHVLLLHRGRQIAFSALTEFLGDDEDLGDSVVKRLEAS